MEWDRNRPDTSLLVPTHSANHVSNAFFGSCRSRIAWLACSETLEACRTPTSAEAGASWRLPIAVGSPEPKQPCLQRDLNCRWYSRNVGWVPRNAFEW